MNILYMLKLRTSQQEEKMLVPTATDTDSRSREFFNPVFLQNWQCYIPTQCWITFEQLTAICPEHWQLCAGYISFYHSPPTKIIQHRQISTRVPVRDTVCRGAKTTKKQHIIISQGSLQLGDLNYGARAGNEIITITVTITILVGHDQ